LVSAALIVIRTSERAPACDVGRLESFTPRVAIPLRAANDWLIREAKSEAWTGNHILP